MAQPSPDTLFSRAIDLVINQDDVVQAWAARYMTIQSGLAIAAASVFAWKYQTDGWLATAIVGLIGTMAVLFAVLMRAVIDRRLAWQRAYIESAKQLQGTSVGVYRENMVGAKDGMRITNVVERGTIAVVLFWLAVVVALVIMQACHVGLGARS